MDWKKLLKELDDAGYTQTRIGDHCGASQSAVSELARGMTKQPNFAFGSKLIELHAIAMREKAAAADAATKRLQPVMASDAAATDAPTAA